MNFDDALTHLLNLAQANDPRGFESAKVCVEIYLAAYHGTGRTTQERSRLARAFRDKAPNTPLAKSIHAHLTKLL